MKSKSQQKFTDEMLHFLYSSSLFQSFTEEEQVKFLQRYEGNEAFLEILQVALSLNEVIAEVKRTMPPITEEVIRYFKQPRRSILTCLKIEDNVYHYPFSECIKEKGPFIICLQQGDRMENVSLYCKGMLMPLFEMCYRQKRDLIILPFSDDVEEIRFEYGKSSIQSFDKFVAMFKKGDAKIIPLLERIITIFEEADVKDQIEVMLITNNEIANFSEGKVTELIDVLKENSVSITAVAISENLYEKNPMHFFEKMYFVNK